MRKHFLSLGVVLAALGFLPAAAQAHHIDHAASSFACVLANGVPTIQGTIAYRDFEDQAKPVYYDVYLNDKLVDRNGPVTWSGPNFDQPYALQTQPGNYAIKFYASWYGWKVNDTVYSNVTCPAPSPPIPTPMPTPTPPPPPVVTPTPPPAPPVPPHIVKAHCPTIHLIMPTTRHGIVDFGGWCSKGKIVDTTMYVMATGPRGGDMKHGRRIVCGTARLHAKGPIIHGVWLYDQTIFCHREVWGSYSLIFVFHVRIHGHVYRCVKRAHYFDHDPGGLPDDLVHAARNPRR